MKRRNFLGVLGSAVAWPLAARAQQPAMPVIGFLNSETPAAYAAMVTAFRRGLSEVGYVEGQNVAIEYRWAGGQNDRLATMAAELVHRQVSVIAANTAATQAAKTTTTTIPIVFSTSSDPVALGFVGSLNRPEGNVTGVSNLNIQLAPKRLEVLHELVPSAKIIALLVNPANSAATAIETKALQAAASAPFLGADLATMPATRPPHTNASENDIRAFVTKRKISGGTVSDKGRDARDIMLGLAKTCMKLKVSFYDFIGDRLGVKGSKIPPLASLVRPAPA